MLQKEFTHEVIKDFNHKNLRFSKVYMDFHGGQSAFAI